MIQGKTSKSVVKDAELHLAQLVRRLHEITKTPLNLSTPTIKTAIFNIQPLAKIYLLAVARDVRCAGLEQNICLNCCLDSYRELTCYFQQKAQQRFPSRISSEEV